MGNTLPAESGVCLLAFAGGCRADIHLSDAKIPDSNGRVSAQDTTWYDNTLTVYQSNPHNASGSPAHCGLITNPRLCVYVVAGEVFWPPRRPNPSHKDYKIMAQVAHYSSTLGRSRRAANPDREAALHGFRQVAQQMGARWLRDMLAAHSVERFVRLPTAALRAIVNQAG